jgi:hypothetical protein
MLEVGSKRVNAGGTLALLGLRADSSAGSGNDCLWPFADIDPVPASTKMLPPRELRRVALCAAVWSSRLEQAAGLRLKASRRANIPSYL